MSASSLKKPTNQSHKQTKYLEPIFSSRNCLNSELPILFLLNSVLDFCHLASLPTTQLKGLVSKWPVRPLCPNQGSVFTSLGLTPALSGDHFLLMHRLFLVPLASCSPGFTPTSLTFLLGLLCWLLLLYSKVWSPFSFLYFCPQWAHPASWLQMPFTCWRLSNLLL